MSVHKDEKTGKWYYTGKYRDLAGKRHDYKKRGFKTKKEAKKLLQGFNIEFTGTGDNVIDTSPNVNSRVKEGSTIKVLLN